jgi:3-hydroxybutyryl-CoA dehydrogenase
MKLVEMSPGLTTSTETFSRAWSVCEALGQKPVRTQDTPGFVLNYFLIPFNNDAIRLVEQLLSAPLSSQNPSVSMGSLPACRPPATAVSG